MLAEHYVSTDNANPYSDGSRDDRRYTDTNGDSNTAPCAHSNSGSNITISNGNSSADQYPYRQPRNHQR